MLEMLTGEPPSTPPLPLPLVEPLPLLPPLPELPLLAPEELPELPPESSPPAAPLLELELAPPELVLEPPAPPLSGAWYVLEPLPQLKPIAPTIEAKGTTTDVAKRKRFMSISMILSTVSRGGPTARRRDGALGLAPTVARPGKSGSQKRAIDGALLHRVTGHGHGDRPGAFAQTRRRKKK